MKELVVKVEDTAIKLNGCSFATMTKFVTLFDHDVWKLKTPGGVDMLSQLHICFLDGCGLLALAFNDKDEGSTKDIAALKSAVRKAGYNRVNSMVIENTYSKLLLKCFGKK